MEVTFGAGSTPVETIEVKQVEETPPPTYEPPATQRPSGFVLGDRLPGFKDVILPRLNLVQNIGKLKDMFHPGELVFNQATVLFTPPVVNRQTGNVERQATPPVILTVLGIVSERFSEKVQGGIGGAIVNTEAEVRAQGGTLDYKEWDLKKSSGMKRFENLTDLLIAIERPEHVADDDTVFGYQVGTKKYALGLWALKGSSYTAAMKRVFNVHRLTGCLRGGFPTHNYSVVSREDTFMNNNKAWIPICTPKEKSTPEFMDFVCQILNPIG